MAWETMWKPFDVEKMIKEMNLLWGSFFTRGLRRTRKSIDIVETKEIVVKKVNVSKATKKDKWTKNSKKVT
jgi:hypothetical protein